MSPLPSVVALLVASTTVAQVVPGASPVPAPTVSAQVLPEIGRVKTASPVCTAIRDLVVPSLQAVHRANVRYAEVGVRLHRYVQIVDNEDYKKNNVYRQGALGQLDIDTTVLKREVLAIDKALGDARLSEDASANDKAIATLRDQLEKLYVAQSTRVNLLQEYVIRERVAVNKADFPGDAFGGPNAPAQAAPTPVPGTVEPPRGMPQFHGMAFADAQAIDTWVHDASAYAHAPEGDAARAFARVAQQRCR
ncbi:MAG: hypothetical protein JWN27_4080 [Candidatus Eremiobacteraeota bacterium]|nr:hypothetical protein [Candidatus Eremiobacteraeota bacterium]